MPDNPTRNPTPGWLRHPVALAAVVTLVNAAKPAVVDDTAYLLFARHIAAHPFDPYGFELFWYREPEPAMNVLAPPVVPYWLAAGIRLFGEDLAALKLWLFPFPLILAYATRYLLARFTPGVGHRLLPAVVLGPGVLPFLNVMLDIPALALQVAAVALLIRGIAGRRVSSRLVVAAGVCTGLALQTKYSVLLLPAVLIAYGSTSGRFVASLAAVILGAIVFAVWEWFLVSTYGTSHFIHHVVDQTATVAPGAEQSNVLQRVVTAGTEKFTLITPLAAYLGATAWWVGPLGWGLFGEARRLLRWVVGIGVATFAVILVVPGRWVVLTAGPYPTDDRVTVNGLLFAVAGGAALAAGVVAAADLMRRRPLDRGRLLAGRRRANPAARFLVAWFVIELAGYFVLTPFPAGRRVLGVSFVLALVVGCLWSRYRRLPGKRPAEVWLPCAAVVSGVVLAGIDTLDAYPEKELPRQAAAVARDRGWPGTGWFVGHWGFQYYCDRLGMKPLLPGRSELRPGDWVLFPVYPDENWFGRPYDGRVRFPWDESAVVREVDLVWADPLSAQTVPNLYGGRVPVLSRKYPRLRVAVYRVVKPWRPTAAPPA